MLVAIHQPEHLPWLGFFEKMQRADLFVLLDDVQFSKGDFQNRNRVKGSAGVQWLTVPIVQKFPQKINEVEIAGDEWRLKHWKTLSTCYARSPHFAELLPVFEEFYHRRWEKLVELNVAAIRLLARLMGLETKIVLSSEMKVAGQKSDLILNICKEVGATAHYSGVMGGAYLDQKSFHQAGIEIVVQSFSHPTYQQLFMKKQGFVPKLSVLDLLFNCGAEGLQLIGRANAKAAAGRVG
jgi:hypothetical protein